jgi:hypothetical protein
LLLQPFGTGEPLLQSAAYSATNVLQRWYKLLAALLQSSGAAATFFMWFCYKPSATLLQSFGTGAPLLQYVGHAATIARWHC